MDQLNDISVNIVAPARLHLGFIDMYGGLGRFFGSLGVSLSGISAELSITRPANICADGSGF